ncbi:MAG: Response regulator [Acidobacteriales bacterium]|nr:Response regulator [Terriglobales bacterium]
MVTNAQPRVLVVDDEPQMRKVLADALQSKLSQVSTADCAESAAGLIRKGDVDVVLLDVYMPGASGLELLDQANRGKWDAAFILISGTPVMDGVISAMRLHAADFLTKPVRAQALHDSINKAYESLMRTRESRIYQIGLETTLQERSRELQQALVLMESNYSETLMSLTTALDAREHATCAHSYRVRAYTSYMAELLHYPVEDLRNLHNAALLHDIGKIGIPDSILLKPGKLSAEETEVMKQHPVIGEEMLNNIPFLRPSASIIRHHHERFDGRGYPDNLAGEEIPLGARIFALADTLDAMTSSRCYRESPGFEAVRSEVSRGMGTQFDPEIARVFLEVPERAWKGIREGVELAYESNLWSTSRQAESLRAKLQLMH